MILDRLRFRSAEANKLAIESLDQFVDNLKKAGGNQPVQVHFFTETSSAVRSRLGDRTQGKLSYMLEYKAKLPDGRTAMYRERLFDDRGNVNKTSENAEQRTRLETKHYLRAKQAAEELAERLPESSVALINEDGKEMTDLMRSLRDRLAETAGLGRNQVKKEE